MRNINLICIETDPDPDADPDPDPDRKTVRSESGDLINARRGVFHADRLKIVSITMLLLHHCLYVPIVRDFAEKTEARNKKVHDLEKLWTWKIEPSIF